MKKLVISIICVFIGYYTYSQDFDCETYYEVYCQGFEADSVTLLDGSQIQVDEDCVDDLDAFCRGVQDALNTEILSIRSIGDPSHVSSCAYHAYERFGVRLVMTGDIVFQGVADENRGYNFIMNERIKKQLNQEQFDNLRKIDSTWLEFEKHFKSFVQVIDTQLLSDSTAFVSINKKQLSLTPFGELDGGCSFYGLFRQEILYLQ